MSAFSPAARAVGQGFFNPLADVFVFGPAPGAALRCGVEADPSGITAVPDKTASAEGDADPVGGDDRDADGDPGAPPTDGSPTPDDGIDDRDADGDTNAPPTDGAPTPDDGIDDRDANGTGDGGVLTSYTSGGDAAVSYNITITFEGSWTADLQQAFIAAADYLSQIILADLPDILRDGVMYDDLQISATLAVIDGPGGILGQAGPTQVRGGSYLPITGIMEFDIADAATYLGNGLWEDIVLHEMMHTLGFGTLWDQMGLLSGSIAGGDLVFTGILANSFYTDPGLIPVETDGGAGTAGGHWDEVVFDNEIMTGYIDNSNFISEMTIAALEDMGYDTVIDDPADAGDLFGPIPADPLIDLIA